MVEDAAYEDRIAMLEGELRGAVDQEAETAQRVDSERQLRAALDQQLHEAREEASRLRLAEAEEFLQGARVEAAREADQITKHASDKADEIVVVARRNAGREEVRPFEDEALQNADLATEHRELTHRLGVMETVCDELVATLKLVAEISNEELVETQDSLKQLDPRETQQPPAEPNGKETTPGSAPPGDLLDSEQAKTDRLVDEARRVASKEPDQLEPSPVSVPESDDDGGEELTVIIDDRDLEPRRSRFEKWRKLNRVDRDSKKKRARQDEAISERFSRVLSSSNGVESADSEEVEARIRNMSHGTNSE